MKTKTITVPQHSFAEMLSIIGRQQHTADLYIIEEGGNESNPGNFIQYPFRSDHFIILMHLEGTGHSKINFADYYTHKGQLLIIPPNAIRQFFELPPDCRFAALVFTSNFLTQNGLNIKLTDLFDFFSSTYSHSIDPEPPDFEMLLNILQVLQLKYASIKDAPLDQQVLCHLFQAFLNELSSIYQQYNSQKKIQYTRKEDICMRFIKQLNDSFREERSVLFYAEQLFVTPRYLSQTVKEVTGKSAGELIDEMVIIEAKVLLNNPSFTISQVAESLYFSDQFFFSKFFKRQTGISPSEYRRLS
jgi:AraC family transcriptional regulator, transcriptional activator of pobA